MGTLHQRKKFLQITCLDNPHKLYICSEAVLSTSDLKRIFNGYLITPSQPYNSLHVFTGQWVGSGDGWL